MASIKPIDVMALSVVLNGETMTLGEAVGKLREMVSPKHHAAVADERDARIAELEAECERLREENDVGRELIASAAPLAWLHTNQECRGYGEALNFATEWERRGLAFVQLGETDFRSLKSKLESAESDLAASRVETEAARRDCDALDTQHVDLMQEIDAVNRKLAAARADAVREFAEWCNGEDQFLQFDWERMLARYLAERGGK